MSEYSLEVSEGVVKIHGYLTIDEAIHYLEYFANEGFTCVNPGDENSTLLIVGGNLKKDER